MSCYINVYIKDKKTKRFTKLFSMGRSSAFYEAFGNYNLWEKCRPFSILELGRIQNEIRETLEKKEEYIEQNKKEIDFISQTNGSLEEKLGARAACLEAIEDTEYDMKSYKTALELLSTLAVIAADDFQNSDDVIYIGVENADPNGEEDE